MRLRNWKSFNESEITPFKLDSGVLISELKEIISYSSNFSRIEKGKQIITITDTDGEEHDCKSYIEFVNRVTEILFTEGWTKETLQKAVDESVNKSINAEMDLFLYYYNKKVELGGFLITDEDFFSAESELKKKIGYGYHTTQYGRIRHLQNYKDRQETLFTTLFNITFQTIFFGFIEDDNNIKRTAIANQIHELLSNPDIVKSLRIEPIEDGVNLLPMCTKWDDLIQIVEKTEQHYVIQFKIIDFFNSKFAEELSMSLKEFTAEFHAGLDQLRDKTHGMISYTDIKGPGKGVYYNLTQTTPTEFIKIIYNFYL